MKKSQEKKNVNYHYHVNSPISYPNHVAKLVLNAHCSGNIFLSICYQTAKHHPQGTAKIT